MPRKARAIYQGKYYHIVSRGNNRQILFREEDDFRFYLELLGRYQQKFSISLLHYCLMTNHVHLLMQSLATHRGITKAMHGIQMIYARHYKKKYHRTGHVFEDRFKHYHIESDAYLLECGRYIERNPVRARMAQDAGEYSWSSFRYYAFAEPNKLITENPLYKNLGDSQEQRCEIYREYLKTPRAYEILVDKYFSERVLI